MTLATHHIYGRPCHQVALPSWMEKSHLVHDHLHRGEVFVIWLDTGMLGAVPGRMFRDEPVIKRTESEVPDVIDVAHYRDILRRISREAKIAAGE